MEKSPFPCTVDIRVRGYELDPWGHVNNAVYLNWLEHARWEMSHTVAGFSGFFDGILPVVRHVELAFERETLLRDTLRVGLWPRRVGTTSFVLGCAMRIIDAADDARVGHVALLATMVLTCIRRPGGKTPVPQGWRQFFPLDDPGPTPPEGV